MRRAAAGTGGAPTRDMLRVLVADDDPTMLSAVCHALELIGYEVTRAEDGDEFLQRVAEFGPFDLIVTDVAMPWMTGLQVAHSVRAAGSVPSQGKNNNTDDIDKTELDKIGDYRGLETRDERIYQNN